MSTRAALRYAKAILNLALEHKSEDAVNADLQLIAETIAESHDLEVLLKSPVIKLQDKLAVLKNLFGDKVTNHTLGLLELLGENKRLDILSGVASSYQVIYNHLKLQKTAEVTTAVPLSAALETKVLAKIKELTGSEATIKNIVNPEIIGGFILRVGDVQFDASVSKSLTALERSFDASQYEAKI